VGASVGGRKEDYGARESYLAVRFPRGQIDKSRDEVPVCAAVRCLSRQLQKVLGGATHR